MQIRDTLSNGYQPPENNVGKVPSYSDGAGAGVSNPSTSYGGSYNSRYDTQKPLSYGGSQFSGKPPGGGYDTQKPREGLAQYDVGGQPAAGASSIDMSNLTDPYSYSMSNSVSGPSMSMSGSGLDGQYNSYLNDYLQQLSGMVPMYGAAIANMMNLPGQIDQWAGDLMSNYRASGLDAMDVYGQVGNQMADRGVVGGNVPAYERAIMMDELSSRIQDQQAQALTNSINQKVQAIMGVPGAASSILGAVPSALNQGQQSNAMSYGSGSQSGSVSYQTDPTAWGRIIFDMIKAGYTG